MLVLLAAAVFLADEEREHGGEAEGGEDGNGFEHAGSFSCCCNYKSTRSAAAAQKQAGSGAYETLRKESTTLSPFAST